MKCPNCNNVIRATEVLDSEWFGNEYCDVVEGVCSKCGKIWEWEEIYTFKNNCNIREINPNEHL